MDARHSRGGAALTGLALGAALVWAAAYAQDDAPPAQDLTLPPSIDDVPPGRARLAAPPPERRDDLDEVVVIGESEWRLPDLGSDWRAREEAERADERIQVSFLPLYDPQQPLADYYPLGRNRELERLGFIELFRVEFGRRSTD